MKTWKVLFKGNNSSFWDSFQAKHYSTRPGVIVLHNSTSDNPVVILSIKNIYYIRAEEELR